MENFERLDLNLLVTLDALLSEHHVTRAARRLHLSQPAVSVQLARLREVFGDPLLLPGPRGMRPTARAEELRGPLREALASLRQAVVQRSPFDPSASDRTWRIAAADYGEAAVLLPALPLLRRAAPAARFAVMPLHTARLVRQLETGDVDLALHTTDDAPEGLRQRELFDERYVLAARAEHPRLKRRPTAAQFCALEHVIVSPDGGGFRGVTDDVLAQHGLSRRVVLSVPHFLFVPSVLLRSDLVAMLPARLARQASGLRVVEPPWPIPGYRIAMLWHERSHREPAHEWLRQQIVASLGD